MGTICAAAYVNKYFHGTIWKATYNVHPYIKHKSILHLRYIDDYYIHDIDRN